MENRELIGIIKLIQVVNDSTRNIVMLFSENNVDIKSTVFTCDVAQLPEKVIEDKSLVSFFFEYSKGSIFDHNGLLVSGMPKITRVVDDKEELTNISLSSNLYHYKIGVENILRTGILNLGHCNLTEWPEELFELTWLDTLIMGDNTTWDDESKKLIEKRENISYENQNNLDQIPDHIKTLKKLKVFSIGGDYAKYYPIKSIGGLRELKSLEVLDLSFCRLVSMKEISGLQNLHYLDLSDNLISNTDVYGVFRNLKTLKLSNNSISEIHFFDGYLSLESLDLSFNQISEMQHLEALRSLKILNLEHNKISKFTGINNLRHLEEVLLHDNNIEVIDPNIKLNKLGKLDLSKNKIHDIEHLNNFENLKSLALYANYISEIDASKFPPNLEILSLGSNQIFKIYNLNSLQKLTWLSLAQNIINSFGNLDELKSLLQRIDYIDIINNPFSDESWIAKEWLNQFGSDKNKILERLDEYLKSPDSFNSEYEPPTKIILLGNSGAGKSTLALSLILDRIPTEKEREETTHGLKIRKWEKANAIIYDFGGQDYYHAVYNVFFTNQTQYVVIWNDISNLNKKNDTEVTDSYYHFDHRYWLGNINYFLADKDKTNTIALFNSFNRSHFYIGNDDISTYKVNHFYPVAFPYPTDIKDNIEDLQRQIVAMAINKSLASLKNIKGYHKLEAELMNRVSEKIDYYKTQTTPLSRIDFFETFGVDKKDLKESSIDEDSLLSMLHHRGLIYRLKGKSFHDDKIWVNPESLNFAIHQKLTKAKLVKTNGVILHSNIGKYFDQNILAVMIETQMIFKHEYGPSETEKVVEYILPQYLPLIDGSALYHLATSDMKQSFTLKFRDFLPQGMMSRLICRFGLEPDKKYFYRYEMIFTIISIDAKIKIKLDMIKMTIEVHVVLSKTQERLRSQVYQYLFASILGAYHRESIEHLNFEAFMAALKATNQNEQVKIDTIAKDMMKYVPSGMMLSLDGQHFVDYKDLQSGTPNFVPGIKYESEDLISFEKTTLPRHLFNPFVNEESKTPKKIFISYSKFDGEENHLREGVNYLDDFKRHLSPLSIYNELIISWDDTLIQSGENWNDRITNELKTADIIFMLISPDFLSTKYIKDTEMKIAFEREQNKECIVVPIIIRDCGWQDIKWLPDLNALPRKGHTIASWSKDGKFASKDDAWLSVYEGVKEIIIGQK